MSLIKAFREDPVGILSIIGAYGCLIFAAAVGILLIIGLAKVVL